MFSLGKMFEVVLFVRPLDVAPNEWHSGGCPLLVFHVFSLEKVHQRHFLDEDAFVEELPTDDCIQDDANGVAEHDLGAD